MDKKVVKKEKTEIALPQEYFDERKDIGLSGLSVDDIPVPSLSIIQSNSKWRDEDGRPFIPGKFYYKALRRAYDIVNCSILVISKRDLPSYEDKDKLERTYMVLGVIEPGQMPFMMYAKSSAFYSTRQFIGEVKARKYPMYALEVQLSTEKRQNDYGEWYMPVFTILGVKTDSEELVQLEQLAREYDMNQDNLRSEDEIKTEAGVKETVETGEVLDEVKADNVEPGDIPF